MSKEQEKMAQYQRAQEIYFETQRRKDALQGEAKRLFEKLEKVDTGRYSASVSVALTIVEVFQNNAFNAFCTIFNLGFLKGQAAEKARQKKKLHFDN